MLRPFKRARFGALILFILGVGAVQTALALPRLDGPLPGHDQPSPGDVQPLPGNHPPTGPPSSPTTPPTTQPPPKSPTHPQPQVLRARFSWSLPARYTKGWYAYDSFRRRYDPRYVDPDHWSVAFNACASSAGDQPIERYVWRFQGVDGTAFDRHVTTVSCNFRPAPRTAPLPPGCMKHPDDCTIDLEDLPPPDPDRPPPPAFPQQGAYRVTLTVVDRAGNASAPVTHTVVVKDWLIVSIGDSAASGEGNPDDPTEWHVADCVSSFGIMDCTTPAKWQDEACHRSMRSAPALAAQAIENADPHTSVTFISLACTGAEIQAGLINRYDRETTGQIPALRRLLCDAHRRRTQTDRCATEDERPIDALFMSIGVNDISFASIITLCAGYDSLVDVLGQLVPGEDVPCQYVVEANGGVQIPALTPKYRSLDQTIRDQLNVREIYITEYPGDIFGRSSGCGAMHDISEEEAQWLADRGADLDDAIHYAAVAWGWNDVGGITERFAGHDYCSDSPWYVAATDSFIEQANKMGTVHPNSAGHQAIAQAIVDAFGRPKPDRTPTKRVRITFQSVTGDDTQTLFGQAPLSERIGVSLRFFSARLPSAPPLLEVSVPNGKTNALDPQQSTYTVDVAPGYFDTVYVQASAELPGAVHLHPKTGEPVSSPPRELRIAQHFTGDQEYGRGSHTATSNRVDGFIRIRYTIEVIDLTRPHLNGAGQIATGSAAILDR